MLGNLVGAEGLKREGIQQNNEGKAQEAQGQLSDLGSGVADRYVILLTEEGFTTNTIIVPKELSVELSPVLLVTQSSSSAAKLNMIKERLCSEELSLKLINRLQSK